jgi:LPXTG-motif cell wall-anchored protein
LSKKFNKIDKSNKKSKIHKRKIGKTVISSVVASTLFLTPITPIINNGKFIGFEQESAEAATLAEVGILEDTTVEANLSDVSGSGPYNLNLTLTGTGVGDVGLVNPDTVAVFHAPDLAGDLSADTANVRVEILPVTMEDLPALGTLINDLTGTLTGAVSDIVGLVDDLLGAVPDGVLEINGLEELQNSVNALTNLEGAVTDLLVYEDTVTPTVNNENGTITVDFSDGIDNHLDTAVEDVVLQLLRDITTAAEALEINLLGGVPIVGDLVNGLINGILDLATGTILPAVEEVISEITTGAIDLTGDLAAAQVIGNTTVQVPATVARDTTASGEIPVSGAGVGTNVIDVELLSTLNTETTVTVPQNATTVPEITPIADTSVIEGQSIDDITVEVTDANEVTTEGLPTGLAYDSEAGAITGTPEVSDWGETEEERPFDVTVTASNDVENSNETFTLTVQRDTDGDGTPDVTDPDDDGDGYTDEEEEEAGTDPKDETDTPDTVAPVITPIEDITAIEDEPIDDISVITDEPSEITTEGLPNGLIYDPEAGAITGTPEISDWGETEEERVSNVIVTATDEAGNESSEEFTLTVQRDTDGNGNPDVTDPDDDGDGYSDEDEEDAGTDPKDETDTPEDPALKAPIITPIDNTTAIEGEPIDDISVITDEPSEITTEGLPEGLAYDSEARAITGTPEISDWGEAEEERDSDVTVTATDEDGNSSVEPFILTVQRDTDGDGTPDVTDPDDDGDGFSDEEEEEAGTDPKDETDTPDITAPVITPIEGNTVVEGEPINDIVVETNEPSDITVENLPEGLVYDPEAEVITGTPGISDWGESEEERPYDVVVNATDEAGNTSEESFTLTVQRDTDGDGEPDVTDPDDDGDGYTDEEEEEAGTDPKDETDTPEEGDTTAPVITPIDDITAIENAPIADITVETNEPSEIVVDGLPEGLAYNPETETISGTPIVADWGGSEEERSFVVVVNATDEAGNSSDASFEIVIQRDTDGDGEPDVTDPDDDNDGFTDEDEENAGTDPKDDGSLPATPLEPSQPIDTDGDGIPDVEDSDDDNDGVNDSDEEEAGLDPSNPDTDGDGIPDGEEDADGDGLSNSEESNENSDEITDEDNDGIADLIDPEENTDTEAPVITPIPDVSAEENEPIEDIVIETNEPSEIVVDGLPNGISFDSETGTISGTPIVDDWLEDETKREYTVTVTAEDDAGNTSSTTFELTLERDLSGLVGSADAGDPGNSENAVDGSDEQSGLPETGETQNNLTNIFGVALTSLGALLLAWNKKGKELIDKLKKN